MNKSEDGMTPMKRARTKAGISQQLAATEAGIGLRTYQLAESGQSNVTLATLRKIAHVLKVPVASLVQEDAA